MSIICCIVVAFNRIEESEDTKKGIYPHIVPSTMIVAKEIGKKVSIHRSRRMHE
jgi:hypothetical protein